MKNNKVLYWINQLKRPLCFIIVLSIVVIYFFNYSAYALASGYVDFSSHYFVGSEVEIPALKTDVMLQYYTADGFNSSNVTGTNAYIQNGQTNQTFNEDIVHNANYAFMETVDINGVDYSFADAHMLIGDNLNHRSYTNQRYIFSDGRIAIVNHWIVSESPITIAYREFNNGSFGNFTQNYIVNTLSDNGFYCWDINNYNGYGARFYDLDLFLSSSDGQSGFTNFSLSATDFSFDGDDNYNFNYLKTNNYITVPSDPEPEQQDDYGEYAKNKMNFSMTSYYIGGKMLNNAKQYISIVWPEVVRNHPDNFYIYADYTGKYKDGSLADVVTFNHKEYHNVRTVVKSVKSLMKNGQLPTSFTINIPLYDIVDANNKSMYSYFLDSVSAFSGASASVVENNSIWLQYLYEVGEAVSNFLGLSSDEPLAGLAQDIQSYITTMEITGYVKLVYDSGDDNFQSGSNVTKFDFMLGDTSIESSDNTINQYPDEGQDPYNLPSTGTGTTTNYSYGGTVVNANNSFNAMIEYLYNLDTSDLNNITGNIANNFQYVINQVSDTSDNGFWGVLKETYDLIPEPIWTWLKVAVGVILGSCVYQWVLGGVRIKRG